MLKLNKKLNKLGAYASASILTGMMFAAEAQAATAATPAPTGKSFNGIAGSIIAGISDLPGLVTALAYMLGTLFAVLGLLKIKDHVENPSNAPLKDGLIRLAIGGALFIVPVIAESMQNLIGEGGEVTAETMGKITKYGVTTP